MEEKKQPDPVFHARINELLRYHRAYKRAFVRADAVGCLVWMLGRALGVPEAVRPEEEGMMMRSNSVSLRWSSSKSRRPLQEACGSPRTTRGFWT